VEEPVVEVKEAAEKPAEEVAPVPEEAKPEEQAEASTDVMASFLSKSAKN
jgi:hypothetical protein